MVKKILIFIVPVILIIFYGFKPSDKPGNNNNVDNRNTNPNQVLAVTSAQLNANQINTWFRTNGSFNRDPSTGNAGFEWPKASGKTARYASGLWLGCVVGNDTLIAVAEYSYDYSPGYWSESGAAEGSNDPAYKIYNIYEGNTTSADYLNWPVNQGAYTDSVGNPLFLGSQTQFYSYIDFPHGSNNASLASLQAQVLQTNWAYNVNGPLGNIVFQEYRIINRSTNVWNNTYLAQWTDDDLGTATDDKVGVDTNLNLGYTYNATNNDGIYGAAPPAVGFDFFRGALVESPGDTVRYYSPPGSNNLIVKPNFKDIGLSVFNFYNNGSPPPSDPQDPIETYRVMEGKWKTGESWVSPTGDTVKACYTGDPVTATGWLMSQQNDVRFIQSTGPFQMNPGDTQIIVVAQVIARGTSNLASITSLRSTDVLAQRIFDNNFQVPNSPPVVPTSVYAPGNGLIYLSWSDTAEKISIPNKLSTGTYKFQGYNLYQIKRGATGSNSEDRVLMATYDVNDGITDIQDSVFNNEFGTFIYYIVQKGFDNGISRYFVMDRDYENNTLLYNGTEYRVVVTAYYYDSLGGPFSAPKVAETPITSTNIQKVIPQNLTLGTVVYNNVGDTIPNDKSDLGAMPIVVSPLDLLSASYTATYGDLSGTTIWNLARTMGGSTTTLLTNETNFSGTQDTAAIVDGFLLVMANIQDSGVILDADDSQALADGIPTYTKTGAWTYSPQNSVWFRGPDTNDINTALTSSGKLIKHQFQSRSLGMSWPTSNSFRNSRSRIRANGSQFTAVEPGSATNPMLEGGPLRTVKFVFGESSMAYRYATVNEENVLLTDTVLVNTPYKDMVSIPFSVYAADKLDSSGGALRKLNVGFVDADASGSWNPDGTGMGGFEYTYIFASSYSENPSSVYTTKNPGIGGGSVGFTSMDIMYAWLPRRNTVNGAPLTWTAGDTLTVNPYIITRGDFVPGYPIKYSWSVNGTQIANSSVAKDNLSQVKAYPNPYYGTSRLETDPFARFIYISHLPQVCNIYIYSLDGTLINTINRNNPDPNNSLEKWNMQNSSQIPVASGMYIIVVDAGSIGVKTLKVAIFTPEERIDTF